MSGKIAHEYKFFSAAVHLQPLRVSRIATDLLEQQRLPRGVAGGIGIGIGIGIDIGIGIGS